MARFSSPVVSGGRVPGKSLRAGGRLLDTVSTSRRRPEHEASRTPRTVRMKASFFATATRFRAWLEAHHATEAELIVGFYKKSTGKRSISWSESVDEALCFGWID